jgi:hypothetical protein
MRMLITRQTERLDGEVIADLRRVRASVAPKGTVEFYAADQKREPGGPTYSPRGRRTKVSPNCSILRGERVAVTRSRDGHPQLDRSELGGNRLASTISNGLQTPPTTGRYGTVRARGISIVGGCLVRMQRISAGLSPMAGERTAPETGRIDD